MDANCVREDTGSTLDDNAILNLGPAVKTWPIFRTMINPHAVSNDSIEEMRFELCPVVALDNIGTASDFQILSKIGRRRLGVLGTTERGNYVLII